MSAPDDSCGSGTRRPMAVIGGGVIGAACAHYLLKSGIPVVIVEQRAFGQGSSHGNCGYVSPSHVLPLCRPGAVSSGLKTLLQRNSPFQIRPRLDPALWSWFWRFSRHCNEKDMIHAGHARQALLNASRQIYAEMMAEEVLTDCEWESRGLLFVFQSASHFDHYGKTDHLLRTEFELGATRLEEAELLNLEPTLKPGVAGAWLYECDAHLRPDKLMDAWKRLLIQQGVLLRENCEFRAFEETNGQVSAVVTSAGRIDVEGVVVATGAWTPLLREQLKRSVPIQPGKGYSITMRRPARCPSYPMIFEEHRVAVTPMQSGYRLGSTMEFAGYDTRLNQDRLNLLLDSAKLYLHEPITEPFLEQWYGWRPMSCDGIPMIGAVPRFSNVWMAAGHSMLGVSMATATGKLISELVTGTTPHVDPAPYRVDRF